MTVPIQLVNTFVTTEGKKHIDTLSKMFIISELVLGLNRLPLLYDAKVYIIVPALLYCVFVMLAIVLTAYMGKPHQVLPVVMSLTEYIFCNVFSFVSCKRMQRYYSELNKFDMDVGSRPKITRGSIRNIAQICLVAVFIGALVLLPYQFDVLVPVFYQLIPFDILHILELHYYAHLLSLLTPRMRLINYYMESSLSKDIMNTVNINEFILLTKNTNNKQNYQMKKLMDLYQIIITAYNYLIEAIKWQLLVIIVASFIIVLCSCYDYSLSVIHGVNPLRFSVVYLGVTLVMMLPLFAPCLSGDRLQREVRRLRELLASRLYEDELDKTSRNMARALLSLTETRDLSFSLLRMLDIDIALPFKFVGLLATYLIILLQFEKVINP